MTPFDRFRQTRFFASLDGLRCLSIIAVLAYHAFGYRSAGTFWHSGYYGVDLFFAISGFLITTLLLRERDQTGGLNLQAFYARRSLRIFPLYYATLAVYVALVWLSQRDTARGHDFLHNLPAFITYTTNWFIDTDATGTIFFFAWSLAVEEQFYLLWPAAEKYLPRGLRTVALLLIFGVGLAAGGTWLHGEHIRSTALVIYRSLSPALVGGVIVAHLLHSRRSYEWLHRWLGQRWSSPALLALVGLVVAVDAHNGLGVKLLMPCLVAACVLQENHGLAPFLQWRPAAFVGRISYGVYLFHMLGVNLAKATLAGLHWENDAALLGLSLSITVALAAASFQYFEAWFLQFKPKFTAVPVPPTYVDENRVPGDLPAPTGHLLPVEVPA